LGWCFSRAWSGPTIASGPRCGVVDEGPRAATIVPTEIAGTVAAVDLAVGPQGDPAIRSRHRAVHLLLPSLAA
jgi:hypothetical protein